MVETRRPSLPSLLPEILAALSDHFSQVECVMEPCPNLSNAPFNLLIKHIGELHLVPDSCSSLEYNSYLSNSKKIANMGNFTAIGSESMPAMMTLKITLQQSGAATTPDWHTLLKSKLKKHLGDLDDFMLIESVQNKGKFHLLQYGKSPERVTCKEMSLWLVPVGKIHLPEGGKTPTPPEDAPKKVVKKKIIKKIVKKKAPSVSNSTSVENSPTPEPAVKKPSVEIENGFKLVKKAGSKEGSPVVVEQVLEDVSSVSYLVKMGANPAEDGVSLKDSHVPEEHTNGVNGTAVNGNGTDSRRESGELPPPGFTMNTAKKFDETVNGIKPDDQKIESNGVNHDDNGLEDKSVMSSVSETISSMSSDGNNDFASINPLSPVIKVNDILSSEDDEAYWMNKWPRPGSNYGAKLNGISSTSTDATTASSITSAASTTPSSATSTTAPQTGVLSGFLSSVAGSLGFSRGASPSTTTATRLTSGAGALTPISSESNLAGRVNGLRHSDSSDWMNTSSSTIADRINSRRRSSSGIKNASLSSGIRDRLLSPMSFDSRETTPLPSSRPTNVRGMSQVPVSGLLEVLKTLSYQEMGEYRRVHPHWDELCGQLLNAGYYELTQKADALLQDCQRRVYYEKELQVAITALTSLQVQVLNQVDMLRAPMDEGVLCFPYGGLLDEAFELVNRIQRIVEKKEDAKTAILSTGTLVDLARKAKHHYARFVEPEVDKRMTEVTKLTATATRLQRIDSFLVETQVSKIERDTEQSKTELQWEIEQLKTQNTQIKKDNRELKNNQVRLESRIEVLERKFKTMARLLQ